MKNVLKKAIKDLGIEGGDVVRIGNEYFVFNEKTTFFESVEEEKRYLCSEEVEQLLSGYLDFEVFKKQKNYSDEVLNKIDSLDRKLYTCASDSENIKDTSLDIAYKSMQIDQKLDVIVKENQARKAKEIQGEKVSFWLNIGFLTFIFLIAILTIFIK